MKKNKILNQIIIFILLFVTITWFLDFNFKDKQFKFKKIKNLISKEKIISLKDFYTSIIDVNLTMVNKKNYIIDKKKISFSKYSNKFIKNRYYLDQDDTNLYFVNTLGELFYAKKKNYSKNNFELKKINTNFKTLIGKKFIYEYITVVKDILIDNNKIYLSIVNDNNGCFYNSILIGNLNFQNVKFNKFIEINECKKRWNYSTGGNLIKYKENKLLLTVGDYNSYEDPNSEIKDDPQNINSFYGKILSIDLSNKKYRVISMGHRNPQGLYYDSKNDVIYSTEHGPQGGDEINININPDENKIVNFGWAISSYGEHYGAEEGTSELYRKNPSEIAGKYKHAPLYKSHKNYGFNEPFKFFTPSIGITEIIKVNGTKRNEIKLLVASMGDNKDEGDMTLHVIDINNSHKELNHEKIYIAERIRDMIDLGNGSILMSLESTGSIGLLENIY